MSSSSKKVKKPTKTQLIKKSDKLWSEITKKKAGCKCEVCGKATALNSHHIFSRSNKRLRYNFNNCAVLCVAHHVWGQFSAHKSPLEMLEYLKKKRGDEWYEELREAYNDPPEPLTIQHYQNVLTALKEINNNL